ncbi:ATP-binding cassette domain-containing protein [Nesterenkonia jeotgali]|uniref:ABC-2 type transport system ATP-binding protein n=1 Tax=Nesterenkonia jeotgali TaxID=317018 RepID=A0A0W8ICL3_9MICC|nr:ATP-binding cassette domain-containing protein [Nesterenkonia jeotgali]KUG57679.1 daunorubicin ABC transporter ATP-binding protein [Nesterenkonia jeotgali]MBA8920380.1 ABC-2 type transport system ATP-binding protein [Nesterenkonia jeotgali]
MPSNQIAIRADTVVRRFGDLSAVDGVSLEVKAGEIYGFLGPNGAGKSTLTRILCTLLTPSSGHATVAGYDVESQPGEVRLRAGVALQEAALDDKQTGSEMLPLQGRFYGLSAKATKARVDQLTELVDIGAALDRRIGTYSGGMKRRLDLALALVHDPEVLFLDEPTTGLDPVSRAKVWQEVGRLNQELGMTVFLTTQYLEEADELADRVGIINKGRLVAEGTPAQLKRTIGTDVVVVSVAGDPATAARALESLELVERIETNGPSLTLSVSDGPSSISPIAVALAQAPDVEVIELSLRRPSLDDVFLSVTGEHISDSSAFMASASAPQSTKELQ